MIIWTRSADDWDVDQRLFSANPEQVLRLPCIKVSPLSESDVNKQISPRFSEGSNIVTVFTSAHGAEMFHGLKKVRSIVKRSGACYAVGPFTRNRLQSFTVDATVPAGVSKGKDLADWLINEFSGQDVQFLLPGGRLRAFNLERALRNNGFDAFNLNLYETKSGCWGADEQELSQETKLKHREIFKSGVLCFASPSAVRGFARFWDFTGAELGRWKAVAIGSSTEQACREFFRRVKKADQPSLESLKITAEKFHKL